MITITCNYCHIEKPEDDYWPSLLRAKRCKPCHIAYGNGLKWTKWRAWVQKTWNITRKQFYDLPTDVRRERTAIAREALEGKVVLLVPPKPSNIAPFSYPPKHEKRLRRDGGTTESAIIARKANRDDGFLYIMEHPDWAERKLGWTYNPPSRLSGFNVCCPHKSFTFPYISVYLMDAKLAESIVQAALKEFHVTGEWYLVSRELAIKTIEDYVESLNDRKEQAVG
mgnify:CR=1 FL=1